MRRHSLLKLVFSSSTLLVVVGCCIMSRYDGFVPERMPGVTKFYQAYATTRLRLEGVDLWIQIQNYPENDVQRSTTKGVWAPKVSPEPAPHLRVFLEVSPRESRVEINPRRVLLRLEDGTEIAPSAFWGPGVGSPRNSRWGPSWLGCGKPATGKQRALERGLLSRWTLEYEQCFNCPRTPAPEASEDWEQIAAETAACFVLLFEIENSSGQGLTLVIEDLRSADRPLEVPEIVFDNGWVQANPCV